ALLLGQVAGQAAGSTSLGLLAVRKRWHAFLHVNTETVRSCLIRYRHFPIYSSWAGLLNTGGAQLPPILFAVLFGPAAAGGYMLAQRVTNIPITVISTAVADAFLPSAVEAQRMSELGTIVRNIL